jgi:hypothetical protein
MNDANEIKYQMAMEAMIKIVTERVAANHSWTINQTLDRISELEIFDRLSDVESSLWTESPVDLTEMIETELCGDTIDPGFYFK